MPGKLVDSYGRKVTGIRIALTSRCNLRCIYCHHEGEVRPGAEISDEMVAGVARAAAKMGIRSIKFTGGEPLLRHDLPGLISQIPPEMNISLTTNGILLADQAGELAEAGLDRINVSLDSLEPQRYRTITGGREGDRERVLAGIDAAAAARLLPIKLNVVILKENEAEIPNLIEFCRERHLIAQLIQLLDLKGTGPSGDIDSIERQIAAKADAVRVREMHRRKKYFLGEAEVEIVRPMDNTEFCASCTRLRITSDGKIKPCLLRNDNLVDIDSCSPGRIAQLLQEANARREPYFKEASADGCKSCMKIEI